MIETLYPHEQVFAFIKKYEPYFIIGLGLVICLFIYFVTDEYHFMRVVV